MNLEIKDGAVLGDGVKLADYDSEKHTVTSVKSLSSVLKGQINGLFADKAQYVVIEGEAKEIPPEPKQDPRLGDRTLAWAEWCREHDPDRFAKHFHAERPYELEEE